jgi:transcription-repair coupling factor (superfamily II helicase)
MAQAQRGKKAILACYSTGSARASPPSWPRRNRPGPPWPIWQEALGIAANKRVTAIVLPLETGFPATRSNSSPSRICWATVWSGARRRKSADAFLAELSALAPGDLVVHMDHGIGAMTGCNRPRGRIAA